MSQECVGGSSQHEENGHVGLEYLPPDELARIMTFLRLDDVHNLLLSSKTLHHNCQEERVWYSMCDSTWAGATDVQQWVKSDKSPRKLASRSPPPAPRHLVHPPSNFRQLYYFLRHVERLCGLWRSIGEGPVGSLVSFSWTSDGIEGEELTYSSLKKKPDRTPCFRLCPRRGLDTEIQWGEDGSTVTLKVHPSGVTERLHRSPSVEAAALVSYGSPSSSTMLGESPEGSFEYAWLEFMANSVAKPSRMRRRSSRGIGPQAPVLHHLRKIDPPRPSTRHPLAGLWVGDYGLAGFQVVRIAYDFTGRAARVVADKITGDEGVAAGQRTFWALAAAVARPWPPEEVSLMDDLQRRQEEAAEEGALEGLEALFLEDDSSSSSEGESGEVNGGGAGFSNGSSRGNKEVVAVHMGAGQVGVGEGQPREWVEGRLWVLADGSLVFWWLEDIMQSVALRRVDEEVVSSYPRRAD